MQDAFNVRLNGKLIDTVFASKGVYNKEEMRKSLINHDGYDSNIVVTKCRPKAKKAAAK
jgi:hypothetical protein